MNFTRLTSIALAVGVFAACAQKVRPPVAVPKGPGTVNVGSAVQLDGSASSDPQGRLLSFNWAFTSRPPGSATTLVDATTSKPSFMTDVVGDYVVGLTVSNALLVSTAVSVTVTATRCTQNPPVVTAIVHSPAPVVIGTTFQLTPTVTDEDNTLLCGNQGHTFTYEWRIVNQAAGSVATFNNAGAETPSITADAAGPIVVELVATDNTLRKSAAKQYTVDVENCGNSSPVVTADVNPARTKPTALVQLTANGTDADAACGVPQPLTYKWTHESKPAGSSAVLSNDSIFNPTFVPIEPGFYVFTVVATDPTKRSSAPARATLEVTTCGQEAPSVDLVKIITPVLPTVRGQTLKVGADVTDTNCLSVSRTYFWTLKAPAGSKAALSDAAATQPTFFADVAGNYELALKVKNSQGQESGPGVLTIAVAPCTPTAIGWDTKPITAAATDPDPAAPAFTDSLGNPKPHVGASVKMTPHASVANYCGGVPVGPLTYTWSFINRAGSSGASFDSATAQTPSFNVDDNGRYTISVVAHDALGQDSTPQTINVDTTTCGRNPATLTVRDSTLAAIVTSALSPRAIRSFEPFAMGTVIATADNDLGQCPVRLGANSAFTWDIAISPAAGSGNLSAIAGPLSVFEALVAGDFAVRVDATATTSLGTIPAAPVFVYFLASACGAHQPQVTSTTITQNGNVISRAEIGSGAAQQVTITAVGFDEDALSGCQLPGGGTSGGTLTFEWTFISGPAGSTAPGRNESASGANFFFNPHLAGTFVYSVVAVDDHGLRSLPMIVTVPTGPCGPTGVDFTISTPIKIGTQLTLTAAAGIADTCVANPLLGYAYNFTGRPANSSANLVNAQTTVATFTPDKPGIYTVDLNVFDQGGFSTKVSKQITVAPCLEKPVLSIPRFTTDEPAGPFANQAFKGSVVRLDFDIAPGTCGPASSQYQFSWTETISPAGSTANLSSNSDRNPTFTPDQAGSLFQYTVQVTDGLGNASVPLNVPVPVSGCGKGVPLIGIGGPNPTSPAPAVSSINRSFFDVFAVEMGNPADVTLNPVNSDQTGCPSRYAVTGYNYSARIVSPSTHSATLGSTTSKQFAFSPGGAGTFVIEAVATAIPSGVASAPAQLTVNVSCGGFTVATPTIQSIAGPGDPPFARNGRVFRGDEATFQTSVLASCFQSANYGFNWKLLEKPLTSTSQLDSNTVATPKLRVDVPNGTYKLSVDVTDPAGQVASSGVLTVVAEGCGANVPSVTVSPATATQTTYATVNLQSSNPSNGDDDSNACPPPFATGGHDFSWQVISPVNARFLLDSTVNQSVNLTPRQDAVFKVAVVATARSTGLSSAPAVATINASCANKTPVVAPTYMASSPAGIVRVGGDTTTVYNGDTVTLHAGASSQCGALGLRYTWAEVSKPAGSASVLSATDVADPKVVFDVADGTWTYAVTVKDELENVAPAKYVTITSSACGSRAPTVTAAPPSVDHPNFGAVNITATAASLDNQNDPGTPATYCPLPFKANSFGILWTRATTPPGLPGAFADATSASTTYTPGKNGTHDLSVVATAPNGKSSAPAHVIVNVNCATPAPTVGTIGVASSASDLSNAPVRNATITLSATATASTCNASATPIHSWSLQTPAGSTAVLSSASAASPTFVADVIGRYTVTVVVSDPNGHTSAPQTRDIDISTCGARPPIIESTSPQQADVSLPVSGPIPYPIGNTVTLSAVVNHGEAGCGTPFTSQTTTTTFELTRVPPGSLALLGSPTFRLDKAGRYGYRATVTDSGGQSTTSNEVLLDFADCGEAVPSVSVAFSPLSDIPLTSTPTQVTATATAADADNGSACRLAQTLTTAFAITRSPSGSTATLSGTGATRTFTPNVPGAYDVTVTVDDGTGRSSSATATMTVTAGCADLSPLVNSISPTVGVRGTQITASASITGRNCLATNTYEWHWELITPAGSNASLDSTTAENPKFTPDVEGIFTLKLFVVNSRQIASAQFTQAITVGPCGQTPLDFAGTGAVAPKFTFVDLETNDSGLLNTGATMTLTATAFDPNTCGTISPLPITYHWEKVAAPEGSTAQLVNPDTQSPTFVPDVVGRFQFRVKATDALGNSSAWVFVTADTSQCGAYPLDVTVTPDSSPDGTPGPIFVTINNTLRTLAASVTSKDKNAAFCPVRFNFNLATVNVTWTQIAGGAAILFGTPSVTFKPESLGQHVVRATATLGTRTGHDDAYISSEPAPQQPTAINVVPFVTVDCRTLPCATYTASTTARDRQHYNWTGTGPVEIVDPAGVIAGGLNTVTFRPTAPGVIELSVVEINLANAESASTSGTTRAIPLPDSPATIVLTDATPLGGGGFAVTENKPYTAVIIGPPGSAVGPAGPCNAAKCFMSFAWSIPLGEGSTGLQVDDVFVDGAGAHARSTLIYTAALVPALQSLSIVHINCTETNAAGVVGTQGSAAATVAKTPVQPTISNAPANVTAGDTFTANASRPDMTYTWTNDNGTPSPAVGASVLFTAGSANANGTSKSYTLTVTETNLAGDTSSAGTFTGQVFPRPQPPNVTMRVIDANGGIVTPGSSLTAGRTFYAEVVANLGMHYLWNITNAHAVGAAIGSGFSSAGTTGGGVNFVRFVIENTDVNGNPVNVAITVREINASPQVPERFAETVIDPAIVSYPRPVAANIAVTRGSTTINNGGDVTEGDQFNATISRQPSITYNWSATNSNPGSAGDVTAFDFTATRPSTTTAPVDLVVTVIAKNAINATTPSTFTMHVHLVPVIDSFTVDVASPATPHSGTNKALVVTVGDTVQLSSTSRFGTETLSSSDPTNAAIDGLRQVTPSQAGTYTFTLTVTNPAGYQVTDTVTVQAVAAPVINSFTVAVVGTTPSAGTNKALIVTVNDTVQLTTDSTGGTEALTSSDDTNAGINGSKQVTPSAVGTYTFTLTVTNLATRTATDTVTVQAVAAPTASLTANPTTILSGDSSTLTVGYTGSAGSATCGAPNSACLDGASVANGATPSVAPTATTTYTLTVINPAGTSATATATVAVNGWVSLNNTSPFDTNNPDTTLINALGIAIDPDSPNPKYLASSSSPLLESASPWSPVTFSPTTPASSRAVEVAHPMPSGPTGPRLLSVWALGEEAFDVFRSTDGTNFSKVTGTTPNTLPASEPSGIGTDIKLDPSDASQQTVYAAFRAIDGSSGSVWVTVDDGANWFDTTTTQLATCAVNAIAVAKTAPNAGVAYAGCDSGKILFNGDGWVLALQPTTAAITGIAVSDDGNKIIAGSADGHLYVLTQGGTLIKDTVILGGSSPVNPILFGSNSVIFGTAGNKVFFTSDEGGTIRELTFNLPDSPMNSVLLFGNLLYGVGSTAGIWRLDVSPLAPLLTWTSVSNTAPSAGLPFNITIDAKDFLGNTVSGFSGLVTLTFNATTTAQICQGSPTPTCGSSITATPTAGVASFTDVSIDTAGSYVLRASAPGARDGLSPTITVGP